MSSLRMGDDECGGCPLESHNHYPTITQELLDVLDDGHVTDMARARAQSDRGMDSELSDVAATMLGDSASTATFMERLGDAQRRTRGVAPSGYVADGVVFPCGCQFSIRDYECQRPVLQTARWRQCEVHRCL